MGMEIIAEKLGFLKWFAFIPAIVIGFIFLIGIANAVYTGSMQGNLKQTLFDATIGEFLGANHEMATAVNKLEVINKNPANYDKYDKENALLRIGYSLIPMVILFYIIFKIITWNRILGMFGVIEANIFVWILAGIVTYFILLVLSVLYAIGYTPIFEGMALRDSINSLSFTDIPFAPLIKLLMNMEWVRTALPSALAGG